MSRSYHATHARLHRLEKEDVSNPKAKAHAVDLTRAELRQKRRTRRMARALRLRHGHAPTPVDSIRVRSEGGGRYVHYPASADDVREVLRRLPRGVTDGLANVVLRLGKEAAEEMEAKADFPSERDPFTGRAGGQRYPGVWSGRILGRYRAWATEIELYGYVFDPAHPDRDVWMPLLRLEALATLAHEVAHHHDHTCRVARGRWIAGYEEVVERYAEAMQHRWTHEVIVPYLRERYAGEVARLERWVEHHGGIAIPFERLVDDPRVTGHGGLVHATRAVWSIRQAISGMLEEIDRGEPAWRVRLHFGRELHYLDRFDEALRVIDGVLAERPHEREARLDRADVLSHLGRNAEALELARALAAENGDCDAAWHIGMDAAEALGAWNEALNAATRRIDLARREGGPVSYAILQRGLLRLSSGDIVGARAELELAERSGRVARLEANRLRRRIENVEAGREKGSRRGRLVRPGIRGWFS
ncbi:MAG TPA: tetratricopeptide repeat protein [Longimicrobium sp.]|nr:tetratricopeptide repeat protein [Longimicrobium sp.]